mmetsp:Transcript_5186/g.7222  ORF Transcript_5186/g.7222 Transcript_5186/m.7222 type:complete len:253 (-) Transcript_5186:978-1736(-)
MISGEHSVGVLLFLCKRLIFHGIATLLCFFLLLNDIIVFLFVVEVDFKKRSDTFSKKDRDASVSNKKKSRESKNEKNQTQTHTQHTVTETSFPLMTLPPLFCSECNTQHTAREFYLSHRETHPQEAFCPFCFDLGCSDDEHHLVWHLLDCSSVGEKHDLLQRYHLRFDDERLYVNTPFNCAFVFEDPEEEQRRIQYEEEVSNLREHSAWDFFSDWSGTMVERSDPLLGNELLTPNPDLFTFDDSATDEDEEN